MRNDKYIGQEILVGDMKREGHLTKYRPVWEDNIKPVLMEVRCVCMCVGPFHLIQNKTISDRRL